MSDPKKYTIGWISALKTEYVAAQALLDEKHLGPREINENDHNHYTLGQIGKHNVVLAVMPRGANGSVSAALAAKGMQLSFPNVRVGFMVGIGGGVWSERHDIRLGDVVVSVPGWTSSGGSVGGVVQYDYGQTILKRTFQSASYLNQPPRVLTAAVNGLEAKYEADGNNISSAIEDALRKKPRLRKDYRRPDPATDRLYRNSVAHPLDNKSPCSEVCGEDDSMLVHRPERTEEDDDPMIHYGLIASADTFMETAEVRDLLAKELDVLCFEMESAGLMNDFPCLVIRGICDYADSHWCGGWRGYAALAAASYARDLILEIIPNRLEAERGIGELVNKMSKRVEVVSDRVEAIKHNLVLERLPVTGGASFDSQAEEDNSVCLQGTRVDLLREITDWATNPNSKPFFWLNGMAGTGKSTVSRTIARSLAKSKHLGASFFFKRGDGDRGRPEKLFTTLARDLVVRKPALSPSIERAIDDDPEIVRKGLTDQFRKLILDPLSSIVQAESNENFTPLVIIVDALDECGGPDDTVRRIISLLSQVKSLEARIFLTSRPDLPVRLGFVSMNGQYQDFNLHEIPKPILRQDISLFLRHEFANIRAEYNDSVPEASRLHAGWPGETHVETLVEMAIPLFIFAATVSRSFADRRLGCPDTQLQRVLNFQSRSEESKLDATYLPILTRLISDLSTGKRDMVVEGFKHIVGSIVILVRPLSIASLAAILNLDVNIVANQLGLLHSVLDVPESSKAPVRMFHQSFRDFLLDPARANDKETGPFWVEERISHAIIAKGCLRILHGALKSDLCGIEDPAVSRSDISPDQVEANLSPELQYSSLYWIHHFTEADLRIQDGDEVDGFLQSHFLHWIEALSLTDRASESLSLVSSLQSLIVPEHGQQLCSLLGGATQFLQAYIATIDTMPLQIYPLVIFITEISRFQTIFQRQAPCWIAHHSITGSGGSVRTRVIEANVGSRSTSGVVFSGTQTMIACGFDDHTIWIWNYDGFLEHRLVGHSDVITQVGFSGDSSILVSASEDGTLMIWNTVNGDLIHALRRYPADDRFAHRQSRSLPIFSLSNDILVASCDNDTVCVWRVDNGECIRTFHSPRDDVYSVFMFADSKLIASALYNGTVRLWDAETGKPVHDLVGHHKPVIHVTVSQNSRWAVSTSSQYTLLLWDISTGHQISQLQGERFPVACAIFSPDSKLLASPGHDYAILVWRVPSWERAYTLRGHTDTVTAVTFSPADGKLIASLSFDDIVRIWDLNTEQCLHVFSTYCHIALTPPSFSSDGSILALVSLNVIRLWHITKVTRSCAKKDDVGGISNVMFSPDSSVVASRSLDGFLKLWCPDTGVCMHTMEIKGGFLDTLDFSPDSEMIACISKPIIRVWGTRRGELILAVENENIGCAYCPAQFSPDSRIFVSPSGPELLVWHLRTGECVHSMQGHDGYITVLAFASTRSMLASASTDQTVRLWTLHNGQATHVFYDYDETDFYDETVVADMKFTDSDTMLVSVLKNFSVFFRCVDTGQCVRRISRNSSPVHFLMTAYNLFPSIGMKPGTLLSRSPVGQDSFRIEMWDLESGQRKRILTMEGPLHQHIFWDEKLYLHTERGVLHINGNTDSGDSAVRLEVSMVDCLEGIGIAEHGRMVFWSGSKLLELPYDFRPMSSDISGSTAVIGSASGKVLFVTLDPDKIPRPLKH